MGFSEFTLIALIALVVIGPKRLPETARFVGLWVGRTRRMLAGAKSEFEKEFGLDEVRQQLHNERIMSELDKQSQPASPVPNDEAESTKTAGVEIGSVETPNSDSTKPL